MKAWSEMFILSPSRWKGLPKLLLSILFVLTVSVSPLHAGSQRIMVNLRGDQVVVPIEVPPKERFVLRRLINVNDQLIAFLYSDPRFRRPVDYAETYNLKGELLEIGWYTPTEGVKRARDINLGNRKARGPARILKILNDLPEQTRVTENEGLVLDSQN
ncbi:MAG: hypothetical protein ACE1Z6_09620 [Candidatus Methylomirabilales bacterium]